MWIPSASASCSNAFLIADPTSSLKTIRMSRPSLWACMYGKFARILVFKCVEFIRPHRHVPSCSNLVEYIQSGFIDLNVGTYPLSARASSTYATSSARAMYWLMNLLPCLSPDSFVCLALLYRDTRHWIWYLASSAMRSPVPNLASSFWSCNCRAHCLTRASRPNVEHIILYN
jgi:hypothetical protein